MGGNDIGSKTCCYYCRKKTNCSLGLCEYFLCKECGEKEGSLDFEKKTKETKSQAKSQAKAKANETCSACTESLKAKLALDCDSCNKKYCTKCLNMKKPTYEALKSSSNIHWFCNDCNSPAMALISNNKTLRDACADYMCSFTQRVEKVEDEMSRKADVQEVMKLKQSVADLAKKIDDIKSKNVNVIEEKEGRSKKMEDHLQDRLARRNNIILYNVHEDESTGSDAFEKNKEQFKKIAEEIGVDIENDDIVTAKRLGKKGEVKNIRGEQVQVQRLLLVTLPEEKKIKMMKNAYKLKSSEGLKKVFIQHDLSKDDREREYQLRKDAKKMQEELNDENFRFLVRGPIWDRKIVKVKKTM